MTSPSTDLANVQTLPQLLAWRSARTPDAEAYRAFDPVDQRWVRLTWAQAHERVALWSRALDRLALPSGARVAILLPSGLHALCMDQATLAMCCVPVPLHAGDTPDRAARILADCEATLLVVEQLAQWHSIAATGTALPHLRTVVLCGDALPKDSDCEAPDLAVAVLALPDWLAAGRRRPPMHTPPCAADLAAIVYPAGAAGAPRGVMLTHRNVLANVKALMAQVKPVPSDVFLSGQPPACVLERTAGYYLPMAAGSCVAYARSAALLAQDLQSVQPTVLVATADFYEQLHAYALQTLAASPLRKRLFDACAVLGWRQFCGNQRMPAAQRGMAGQDKAAGWWTLLPSPLLNALVARPLQAQWGGQLRLALCAGTAPLPPAVARSLLGLGMPLLLGYGLTEVAVVSLNTLRGNRPASTGRPLPGVQVRLGENKELQVHGDSIMKGYWNQPHPTAQAISSDGWLATGERADIVDGRIYLRGRIASALGGGMSAEDQ